MAGIVAGIADLGRGSQGIAYTFGRALVVGRETHSHMAVVEDRIVRPVSLFDLVETRSEEHTSELQSLMRISYAVFCLKKKTTTHPSNRNNTISHCHQCTHPTEPPDSNT